MKPPAKTQNEHTTKTTAGGDGMIREWFSAMHETLDDLIRQYPKASGDERQQLQQQWEVLKSLSDDMIEAWLQFEDKMALFRDIQQHGAMVCDPDPMFGPFVKGQGYFKLQMFAQAAQQLEEAVSQHPDMMSARLFLAMSRMHLRQWNDAQRHFQLIAALADEAKLRAISYNALGCIQAVFAHLEQAQSYFRKALEADPSFADPKRNLESCQQGKGELQLQFGSAELQTAVAK
jgi:tetratricopeptide (TPR) repeat protein